MLDTGTEDQKRRHMPAMLRGDEVWTQLLSEPGAGSDLGGVTTRAARDGDHFVLTGQKVWTSAASERRLRRGAGAHRASSVPKYKGLSMVIVDMRSPGVDVRPLRQMTGDAQFNEVFLDEVRVPVANLLGEYNGGWGVLNAMLLHERIALSAGTTGAGLVAETFDAAGSTLARKRGVRHRMRGAGPARRHLHRRAAARLHGQTDEGGCRRGPARWARSARSARSASPRSARRIGRGRDADRRARRTGLGAGRTRERALGT